MWAVKKVVGSFTLCMIDWVSYVPLPRLWALLTFFGLFSRANSLIPCTFPSLFSLFSLFDATISECFFFLASNVTYIYLVYLFEEEGKKSDSLWVS